MRLKRSNQKRDSPRSSMQELLETSALAEHREAFQLKKEGAGLTIFAGSLPRTSKRLEQEGSCRKLFRRCRISGCDLRSTILVFLSKAGDRHDTRTPRKAADLALKYRAQALKKQDSSLTFYGTLETKQNVQINSSPAKPILLKKQFWIKESNPIYPWQVFMISSRLVWSWIRRQKPVNRET